MPIVRDVLDLTEANTSPTLSAGTADVESEVARFTVPNRTKYILRAGVTTFSLNLADTTPTQVADSSRVRVTVEDPNGVIRRSILDTQYVAVKEFQDRQRIYVLAATVELNPQDVVRIFATADLAADTAQTRFRFGQVLRGTQV